MMAAFEYQRRYRGTHDHDPVVHMIGLNEPGARFPKNEQ